MQTIPFFFVFLRGTCKCVLCYFKSEKRDSFNILMHLIKLLIYLINFPGENRFLFSFFFLHNNLLHNIKREKNGLYISQIYIQIIICDSKEKTKICLSHN